MTVSPGESRARVCGWVPSAGQVSLSVSVGWGDTTFYATVAPLDFVTPERVRSLSVERMVGSPAPVEMDGSPRAIREVIRARLRNLIHKVRRSFTLAQRRYERNYDARVRPVNKDVQAGDCVFVDGHARTKYKLGTRAAGPYKVLARGEGTFSLDIASLP